MLRDLSHLPKQGLNKGERERETGGREGGRVSGDGAGSKVQPADLHFSL